METFSAALIPWFLEEKRAMPWREDPTPYHVWVSEIMLQQTRVDTVIPYYTRFITALPDIKALAECPEDRLYKLFEGLGYYSRVRHMQEAARMIRDEFGGVFPDSQEAVLRLPGIGSYTAGAILSIAMEQPVPVVDGNVLRVYARIFGDESDISLEGTKKAYAAVLGDWLQSSGVRPSLFNQGLMELGALVCLPNGAPHCESCPAAACCKAHLQEKTDVLPVKSGKKARRIEEKTVFLVTMGDRILIGKRTEPGLLKGLYGFPMAEAFMDAEEAKSFLADLGFPEAVLTEAEEKKHIFTHVEWRMRAYRAEVIPVGDTERFASRGYFFAGRDQMDREYALPGAFRKWDI